MKKQVEKILPEYIIDPSLNEREKYWDKYYCMHFYCSNCDRPTNLYDEKIDVFILKVKLVKDVGILICPNCKNLSLHS